MVCFSIGKMIWNSWFFITILFNYCQEYSQLTPTNVDSINNTFLHSLVDTFLDQFPVFNEVTVPNLDDFIANFTAASKNEDLKLNITELVTKYGYTIEEHTVQTSDGYVLGIFHIPGNGTPVMLMHGMLCSSDDFFSTGPERGLPYLLADLGYDVWLGNARGNLHSRRHVKFQPEDAEFWDFSWDEIGRYDTPAIIDYILVKTGQTQLAYIGHSQGTTCFFVMASELPSYNSKISVMIALSAVTFLGNSRAPIFRLAAPFSNPANALAQVLGLGELLPRNQIIDMVTSVACGTPLLASLFCNNLLFIFYGFDYAQVNATLLPGIYKRYPAGCATKQLAHYGQLINSHKFSEFDNGVIRNIEKYSHVHPPDYPLERVTSKVAIFHSDNDYLSTEPDRALLHSRLPNVILSFRVPFAKFTHMDFLFANDVRTLLYNKVAESLQNNI